MDVDAIDESVRASKALLGSVSRHGGEISINLRLVHTQTKDVKFGDSAEGDAEDIFFMAHQLANRLHYRLTGEWIPRESMAGLAGKDKLQELAGLNPALFLSNKESSLKIELGLDRPEHSTYEQMSAMKIVFSVNQDCYMTIYSIDSAGKVTLLYPNSYHRDNYIHSGVTHSIPSAYDGFDFTVSGVGGLESIIAIASTQPLFEFEELFRAGAVMPEVDSSASRFVTRAVHVTKKVRPKDWNSATVHFYLAAE